MAVGLDPRLALVPARTHIDGDHNRYSPNPNVIRVDPCLAVAKRVHVIVRLEQCAGVENETHIVDVVEQQVAVLGRIVPWSSALSCGGNAQLAAVPCINI